MELEQFINKDNFANCLGLDRKLEDQVVAEYLQLSWDRKEHAFEIESSMRFEPQH